jgi:hypothetical protein
MPPPPLQLPFKALNGMREGEVAVFDKFAFILCGPRTKNPLFFMKGTYILASACQLKQEIPSQFRSVVCTAGLVKCNTNPLVQNFDQTEKRNNPLFDELPMK